MMRMNCKHSLPLIVWSLAWLLVGCGGGTKSVQQPSSSPVSVSVSPSNTTLDQGATQQFTATVTGSTNTAVTWSVQEAAGGSVTNTGLYTAPNTAGTFHVVATSQADPSKSAIATATVSSSPGSSGFVAIQGNFDEQDELADLTTTLLADGRALIIGGMIDCASNVWTADCTAPFTILRSAQIYDPSTRTFSFAGSLATGRYGHTATLLGNGKVLVVGGFDSYCTCSIPVGTAEIFDPATGSFSPAGTPQVPRAYHTATLLADGTVLIAGGVQGVPDLLAHGSAPALASAEIYGPVANSFSSVGNMSNPRLKHTATLLPNGMTLIVGGAPVSIGLPGALGDATAELYDPVTRAFSGAGSMATPRFGHTATLLPTGNVLIAGGSASGPTAPVFLGDDPTDSAEIFDPGTNAWSTAAPMNSPRASHAATLLASGQVLFTGGQSNLDPGTEDLYDPQSGASASVGSMVAWWRFRHVAALMPDGSVLVAGGGTGIIELYVENVPPDSN